MEPYSHGVLTPSVFSRIVVFEKLELLQQPESGMYTYTYNAILLDNNHKK